MKRIIEAPDEDLAAYQCRFLALCDPAHRNIPIGDHANEPMVLAHRQDASGAGGACRLVS